MSSFFTPNNGELLQRDWNSILLINLQMYCVSMESWMQKSHETTDSSDNFTIEEKEPAIGKYSR